MLLGLRSRRFATVLVCLLLLTVAQIAHAVGGLTFQGLVRTLNTGGSISLYSPTELVSPTGIAIDSSGNLYVTDADSANSRVVKISPSGAGAVISTGSVPIDSNLHSYRYDNLCNK